MHPVTLDITATDGAARTGVATTANGSYEFPCFMPVGTRGAIKYLSAADYERLGARIVLGNTYHLMLRPGADVVARFGGLGKFAGWGGLTLTDSGGFQVFSLEPKVDDEGVTFASTYDGSKHRFTPESAVATQELLGADIQMVLDVCPPLPSPEPVIRLALERTSAWAKRARAAQFRAVMELKETRNELSLEERREIWQRCVQNPELRFCSTTRHHPSKLGGWRKCLDRAAQLLEGTGRRVPWSEEEALFAAEQ